MYSINDQINNRRVLVYPERKTVISKQTDSVVLTKEQIASTYFPEDIDVVPEVQFEKVEIGKGNFIFHGDNIDVLRTLPDNSIDSCVTDPPYGLKFMNKKWDHNVPSVEFWKEVYRVLKPGGYVLSFGGARTYHRMAINVEDAGFEVRDQLMWVYGSGFPKSHNVGLSIDKSLGHPDRGHRISVASRTHPDGTIEPNGEKLKAYEAKSVEAEKWEAWGTNLKPAHEPILMARKPFKGSVAKNVLLLNTGGINIDDCRISYVSNYDKKHQADIRKGFGTFFGGNGISKSDQIELDGRFPANIFFDEEAGKLLDEQSGITSQGHWSKSKTTGFGSFGNGKSIYNGVGKKDNIKSGASKFFYCPKPSKKEREEGLDNEPRIITGRDEGQDNRNVPQKLRNSKRKNTHSTVKPVALMQYLIRLVTPKGGITIDPFAGSGTSPKATIREGNFKFIAIEKEKEYFDISVGRCQYEYEQSIQNAA
jgi:DNA modification methylase